MQSAINTLQAMDFSTNSVVRCIQEVRQHINSAADPINAAARLVQGITSIKPTFDSVEVAVHVAQYVVHDALTKVEYDLDDSVKTAFDRTEALFMQHPWSRPRPPEENGYVETAAVVEGIETKVAITAEGKIKKGGKQILAVELYKKYVVESDTPLDNQGFVQLLMKELDMSKAGALTYSSNVRKQFAPK